LRHNSETEPYIFFKVDEEKFISIHFSPDTLMFQGWCYKVSSLTAVPLRSGFEFGERFPLYLTTDTRMWLPILWAYRTSSVANWPKVAELSTNANIFKAFGVNLGCKHVIMEVPIARRAMEGVLFYRAGKPLFASWVTRKKREPEMEIQVIPDKMPGLYSVEYSWKAAPDRTSVFVVMLKAYPPTFFWFGVSFKPEPSDIAAYIMQINHSGFHQHLRNGGGPEYTDELKIPIRDVGAPLPVKGEHS
jgi:hypothetical protein